MKFLLFFLFSSVVHLSFGQALTNPIPPHIAVNSEGGRVEIFGDVLCFSSYRRQCPRLDTIIVTNPKKYIWYAETCPSCKSEHSVCNYQVLLKFLKKAAIELYGWAYENDCMEHCSGCDCDSGLTVHMKFRKKDFCKIQKLGGFPLPSNNY